MSRGKSFKSLASYMKKDPNKYNIYTIKEKYGVDDDTKPGATRYLSKELILDINKINPNGNKTFILGGTGTGKTISYTVPQIVNNDCDFIIVDSDGDVYNHTRQVLLDKGYTVLILDLRKGIKMEISEMGEKEHYITFKPFQQIESKDDLNILAKKLTNIIDYKETNARTKYQDGVFIYDLLDFANNHSILDMENFMEKVNPAYRPIYNKVAPLFFNYSLHDIVNQRKDINVDEFMDDKDKKALFIMENSWGGDYENDKLIPTLLLSYICDAISQREIIRPLHFIFNGTRELSYMNFFDGIEQELFNINNKQNVGFSFCTQSLADMNYYLEYALSTADIFMYMGTPIITDIEKIFPYLHNDIYKTPKDIYKSEAIPRCCIIRVKNEVSVTDNKYMPMDFNGELSEKFKNDIDIVIDPHTNGKDE